MNYPNRQLAAEARARLLVLDASGSRPRIGGAEGLPLSAINELPALFQPREDSLKFAPGHSEKHIANLTAYVRRGEALDPVAVVSFGDQWFLVDGHHRLEAYRAANWKRPVPATPLQIRLRGEDRISWAIAESVIANRKDRLAMSGGDKSDAAWRMVVSGVGSKTYQATATGVSQASIGNMRKVARVLKQRGMSSDDLGEYGWRRASFEARDPSDDDRAEFDFAEEKRRKLAKSLVKTMRLRPSAAELLRALEDHRAGFSLELKEALTNEYWEGGPLGDSFFDALEI